MRKRLSYIIPSAAMLGIIISIYLATTTIAENSQHSLIEQLAYSYFQNLPDDHNMIKPDQLFAQMQAGKDIFLVDIRSPEDYQKGHLKGAVNLIFADTSISDAITRIPDKKPVVIYCTSGQDSAQAATLLNIAGKNAKSIALGFDNAVKDDSANVFIEQTANSLPQETYPVNPDIQNALSAYFIDKMAHSGTIFADYNVSAQTVNKVVQARDDGYIVVSILQPDDYAIERIPTSQNIPYGRGMEENLVTLPKDKIIFVQCETGQTSSQTVAVMRMLGYDSYSMTDGIQSWKENNFEVEEL